MTQINSAALAASLRENTADLLALIPAVRRSAEHDDGDTACLDALTRSAYASLRLSENLSAYAQLCDAPPAARAFCASTVCAAFWHGAQNVCKSATLRVQPLTEPIWTRGSARLFAVCLGNLVCNSLLYARDDPVLTLHTEVRAGVAAFTLHDNGKGMLPSSVGRAFTPWVSRDPYDDGAPAPGLGLGLALVQRYAAAYGGRLVAESTFGTGSSITLALPRCAAPSADSKTDGPATDFLRDRYSTLYTQLGAVCALPL
ncbi:MAG: HAMP domain-containing sensor histidine kinase [Ruthenibacterium sp.]